MISLGRDDHGLNDLEIQAFYVITVRPRPREFAVLDQIVDASDRVA